MTRSLALGLLLFVAQALAAPPLELQLAQALSSVERGDLASADLALDSVATGAMDARQLLHFQLLRARIALARNQPLDALRWLPLSAESSGQPAEVEWLRARALFLTGDAVGATRALVNRERYLPSELEIGENRDVLWAGLFATPLDPAVTEQLRSADPTTRGWVELAALVRSDASTDDWRTQYGNHPGTARIAEVRRAETGDSGFFSFATQVPRIRGGGIALLLPLSGALANTGEAVRDGFLAAAMATRTAVKVYDSGATAQSAVAAWQLAERDGAGVIVGPLRKEDVSAIAALGTPPMPWLALNFLDFGAGPNFYQMGLAPEDEAQAAADLALSEGRRRVLAVIPSSDWGERVLGAFVTRLAQGGGVLLETARYTPGTSNFGPVLQPLLNLDSSKARHNALSGILGAKPEFEPRRRSDADMVFVAARTADAHLLVPQLRFYRASDLPVYAPAVIYGGGVDMELNGVRFCDMPYMLADEGSLAQLRDEVAGLPSAKGQPRLFALGYDALPIARQLAAGEAPNPDAGRSASGLAGGASSNLLRRELACVRIASGLPQPVP